MAIRIPTGTVPKNTARTVTFLLGVASLAVSFFPPLAPYASHVRDLGYLLSGLGLTLGKAEQ